MQVRVNAGALPERHWVHDPSQGGGRLLSEGCHFIDLLIHLAGTTPARIETRSAGSQGSSSVGSFIVTLEFANGSAGTVTYATGGSRRFSKELIEVFVGGLTAQIDDFRSLTIDTENARVRRRARFRADKGHLAEWKTIVEHLTLGGPPPIPVSELFASIRATLAAQQSLLSDESVRLDRGGA
jgi:predicted dehydrogenase